MKSLNALHRLLQFTTPYKGKIVLASVCSTLNKLCDIVPEILIGISIDVIVNQRHSLVSRLGISDPYQQLYLVGGLTALLWVLESVFEYYYSIIWRGIAQNIQQDIRIKTYSNLQRLDTAYFENKTTGGLLAVLHDDVNQLEHFLSECPNAVLQLLVNIIAMGALFIFLSPLLAFCAILPIPFVVGIAYYFQDRLALLYNAVRERAGFLSSHIAHRLQGISTIKSYATEGYEENLLKSEAYQFQHAQMNVYKLNAAYIPTIRMAIMVGFIATLIVGGMLALQGTLPLNWYAALVFLTQRFLWPFTSITTITTMYEQSMASARRIFGLLDASPTIQDGTGKGLMDNAKAEICFNNVSFAYGNGRPVLNGVSVMIPAKKTVAFVGTTGSGKSTLIKLLLRFYDTTSGSVSIDGMDIKAMTLADLRSTIALVSQDIYLVEGSIAENIAYGTFNTSRSAIIEAAKQAQADAFIEQLAQGYDTIVAENGKNLSGGQRQRIAIARAILKKAPILIFDEATSAVDNETEAALQTSFAHLAHQHTIIIIAHRLSTIRSADTIYVLDKGTIIESGSHEDLLEKQSAYAKLWYLQIGES